MAALERVSAWVALVGQNVSGIVGRDLCGSLGQPCFLHNSGCCCLMQGFLARGALGVVALRSELANKITSYIVLIGVR